MDGIIIERSPTSNALLVYNQQNRQFYELDSYCIDSYCLPGLVYANMKYDGGLFSYLYPDDNPSFEEKYPPETWVECIDPSINTLLASTLMDFLFPVDVLDGTEVVNCPYNILFDKDTSASMPLFEMMAFIPKHPVNIQASDSQDSRVVSHLFTGSLAGIGKLPALAGWYIWYGMYSIFCTVRFGGSSIL
jgi:hypothetical protein